jgi:hypothetical protein
MLGNVLGILSTISVLGALLFAALQVRAANRTRAEQAAVALVQAVQTKEWMDALRAWQHVPAGLTAEEIDKLGPTILEKVDSYGVQVEVVAYMVFRGIVGIDVAEEMIGGAVVNYWDRFGGWIELERKRTSSPRNFEWAQWLAERVRERRGSTEAPPAYIRYRQWHESKPVR